MGLLSGRVSSKSLAAEHLEYLKEWKINAHPLTLDTKYYTAETEIWILDSLTHENQEFKARFGSLCDALILVVDPHQRSTFEKIKHWTSFIEEFDPNVLLMVSHLNQEHSLVDEDNNSWTLEPEFNEWCLDNRLDFVSMIPPTVQEEEYQPFREKYGIDRILETLETNMWSNMVHKNQPSRPALSKSMQEMLGSAVESTEIEKEKLFVLEDEKPLLEETIVPILPFLDKFSSMKLTADEEIDDDKEEEMEFFEGALKELSNLRSQTKNMPDRERRDLAAKVALSFLQQMNDDSD